MAAHPPCPLPLRGGKRQAANASEGPSRTLLFVMLSPLFPPQTHPLSQLSNLSHQPLLVHSILDKIQLHPGGRCTMERL